MYDVLYVGTEWENIRSLNDDGGVLRLLVQAI